MDRGYMTMEGKSGFKTLTSVVLTEFLRTRSEVQQDKKKLASQADCCWDTLHEYKNCYRGNNSQGEMRGNIFPLDCR